MKTKIIVLILFLGLKMNAQLVQSINSNFEKSYKKEIITKDKDQKEVVFCEHFAT